MKTLIIAVFVGSITFQLTAQDYSFTEPGNNHLNRFYADLIGKAATINGDWGLFGGFGVGYNISNNTSIGLVGYGLIPDYLGGSYINQADRDELHFGYGGLEAVYKYDLSNKLYLTGMLMLGAGRVDYENLSGYDYFFIMEPGASINYRLTNWFGLGYTMSYRFASGVNYADFSDASFSGWSVDLDFKLGF